ncbi:MAG: DPP IV N-terminal domain-containing protein [Bacteroidota bacterium]|nr:DPP IV N-terminal domain-containing protein [Bacteroidota bacterium]
MNNNKLIFLFLKVCITAFISFSVNAQTKKLSLQEAVYGRTTNNISLRPDYYYNLQWVKNTNNYIYQHHQELFLVNTQNNQTTNISIELKKQYPELKYIPQILEINPERMIFDSDEKYYIYDYSKNIKIKSLELPQNAENKDYNVHKDIVAYTIENNLYIGSEGNNKIAITNNSDHNIVSGSAIHRSEFGINKGTFWSPKGNLLAFYQKDETYVSNVILEEDMGTNTIKYPKVGEPSERASVGIYNLKTQKTIYLKIDTNDEHYLTNLTWTPDEKYILLAEVDRSQKKYVLNRYDVKSGKKINSITSEENPKWVEPEHNAVFIPNSKSNFLWFSEKDGFMNLYMYDVSGKFIQKITNFKWVVQEILGFDATGQYVFISGTGIDPREKHTYKINLHNPKEIVQLTKNKGTHHSLLSPDGKLLLNQYSNIETANVVEIIDTQNNTSTTLLEDKNPLEGYLVATTELLELRGANNTVLYAKMHKPIDFDPNKKYPVLVYVYGGPHAQLVTNSWLAGSYLWLPVFAQNEQYIVFTLDNRGSANRGFEFESSIHLQLGTPEVEDQLLGINYLKSLPFIDQNRMAVHGWSYGGFMTSSLMFKHPNTFTTAVAGGTVTDWKLYEIMYGERYMDTPLNNIQGYHNSKLLNHIQNLKGKILYIHGNNDDVVIPQHIVELLVGAQDLGLKPDVFVYPGKHNPRGNTYYEVVEKITKYILENNK